MFPPTSRRRSRESRSGERSTASEGRVRRRPRRRARRRRGRGSPPRPASARGRTRPPPRCAGRPRRRRSSRPCPSTGRASAARRARSAPRAGRCAGSSGCPPRRRCRRSRRESCRSRSPSSRPLYERPPTRVHAMSALAAATPPAGARRMVETSPMAVADPMQERKRMAAEAAAELVEDGMRVGLGTGSTVAHLLRALARRGLRGLRCVATSERTATAAAALGLPVEDFAGPGALDRLDLAIDGADQVAPDWWVVKGGGGAHTREKVVAAAAERFVVIVSDDKLVPALAPPVPVELLAFGHEATLRGLGGAAIRDGWPSSPDGGVIADLRGPVGDPAALAARLVAVPGVVEHGLFAPAMTAAVIVGGPDGPARLASPDG